jgi:hypothetical protein
MKRFTKFIVESIEEADLNEAVEVRHDRYMRSHGKKARDSFGGGGTWAFTHKDRGDVDYKNDKEFYQHSGKFADAKKAAQQWGKKHGHREVYVMESVELDEDMNALTTAAAVAPAAALAASGLLYKGYGKSKRSVMDRIADTKDAKRRHKDSIKQADKYLSKSTNPKTLDKYKKQKDDSQNKLKQSSYLKSLSRNEEFELDEQAMTFQNAEKLKSKHLVAMDHHKKSGNSKGYAAHSMVVRKFEDAYDRHGTGVIPAARILSASQKAFKDHPHSGMKESVELDEISASTLRSYVDKAKEDKTRQQKARTVAKSDAKKYGLASDKERADAAHRKVGQRGTGISIAQKKLGMYPKDRAQPKVMAREEVELDEARSWFDPSDHEQFKNMTPEQKKARHDSLMKLATTHKNYDIRSFAKSAANELKSKYMKEEVELDEAVTVKKKDYSWGKMMTVHHGSSHSFPLHPEHQEKIKKLGDREKTSFRDETGSVVTAHREGDKIHLKHQKENLKTTVSRSHFTESVELDEANKNIIPYRELNNLVKSKKAVYWRSSGFDKLPNDRFFYIPILDKNKKMLGVYKANANDSDQEYEYLDSMLKDVREEVELDEAMTAAHKKLAHDVHKQLKRDEPMGQATGMKLKADHRTLQSKYGSDWRKKAGIKESVELDEVSDKMLDRYRQKAFADQPSGDDGSDKYRKRKFGRDLAFAKQTGRAKVLATKEEFELDESVNDMVRVGQKMIELAPKEKNDMISNAYSKLGDALTRYGTPFGPKNVADLEKKTGMNQRIIMSLIKKVQQ